MANQINRKTKNIANNPFDMKNYEENDQTFSSFIEIFCAILKVGVFITCIYILKEIFYLANDMFFCVENQTIDILKLEIIPASVLLILAGCAFWLMSRD